MIELSTGVLQVGWADPGTPVSFIESGKVRGIAVSGLARLPRLPDVPTMKEAGYPFEIPGWLGLFAPKGVPQAIIDRISTEVLKIQREPDMIARMASLNFPEPPPLTPQQFKAFLESEIPAWRQIVQDADIQPD
jgi:tripartite-type tricarboxylate transporter receptor subunit TctC